MPSAPCTPQTCTSIPAKCSASWAIRARAVDAGQNYRRQFSPRLSRDPPRRQHDPFHRLIDGRAVGIEVVYQDLALLDNLEEAANPRAQGTFGPISLLDHKGAGDTRAGVVLELRSETRPHYLVNQMSGARARRWRSAHPALQRKTCYDRRPQSPCAGSSRLEPVPPPRAGCRRDADLLQYARHSCGLRSSRRPARP